MMLSRDNSVSSLGDSAALIGSEIDLTDESSTDPATRAADAGDAPDDTKARVWMAMVMCGAGFLFPFNTYIAAADYLEDRYAGYHAEFYITAVYIYGTCISVATNLFWLVNRYSLQARIRFGYMMFAISLIGFILIQTAVNRNSLSERSGFGWLLFTVAITATGGGVQQSSYYGYVGMLKGGTYTLALMVGESIAGVAVSFNRIVTKAAYNDASGAVENSTYVFLYLTLAYLLACFFLSEWTYRTPFARYYLANSPTAEAIPLESYGESSNGDTENRIGNEVLENTSSPKRAVSTRRRLVRIIKYSMAAVFTSFLVTLATFPGVATMPVSGKLGDWSPIVVIALFNVGDLVGKILPLSPFERFTPAAWPEMRVFKFTLWRLAFIPAMVVCAAPRDKPLLSWFGWICVITFFLGVTGGYSGTLAMAAGPQSCQEEDREVAGTIMTLSLLCGLATGATLSIVLLSMIDPSSF